MTYNEVDLQILQFRRLLKEDYELTLSDFVEINYEFNALPAETRFEIIRRVSLPKKGKEPN